MAAVHIWAGRAGPLRDRLGGRPRLLARLGVTERLDHVLVLAVVHRALLVGQAGVAALVPLVLGALAAADAFAVVPVGVGAVAAGAAVELEMFRWPETRTTEEALQ